MSPCLHLLSDLASAMTLEMTLAPECLPSSLLDKTRGPFVTALGQALRLREDLFAEPDVRQLNQIVGLLRRLDTLKAAA
jgi:hypothetical protein